MQTINASAFFHNVLQKIDLATTFHTRSHRIKHRTRHRQTTPRGIEQNNASRWGVVDGLGVLQTLEANDYHNTEAERIK